MPFDEKFLRETIEVWADLSPEPLTMADALEIAESMTGFFAALARCAKEAQSKVDNGHSQNDSPTQRH